MWTDAKASCSEKTTSTSKTPACDARVRAYVLAGAIMEPWLCLAANVMDVINLKNDEPKKRRPQRNPERCTKAAPEEK